MGGGIERVKKDFYGSRNTFSASHIVTFHIDTNNTQEVEIDDGVNIIDYAPSASKDGWTFVGWREDTTASSTVLTQKDCLLDNHELYAVFKRTLTITLTGGTTNVVNTGIQYYNNGTYANPSITLGTSAISGWTLIGYRTDTTATSSVSYAAGTAYTFDQDTTLYAVFNRTLTISYNGAGATSGSTAAQTGTQYYNNGNYANPSFTLRANGFARANATVEPPTMPAVATPQAVMRHSMLSGPLQ